MFFKNIIVKVLYILILAYLILFVPSIWGYKPLVVVSGSMEPTLDVGSIVYYKEIDKTDFNVNDILVFKSKDHVVSHRIVDISNEGFTTKGDANDTNDKQIVNESLVLGRACNFCIPLLGYYADFIFNHKFILVIIVLLIIFDLLIDVYRKDDLNE